MSSSVSFSFRSHNHHRLPLRLPRGPTRHLTQNAHTHAHARTRTHIHTHAHSASIHLLPQLDPLTEASWLLRFLIGLGLLFLCLSNFSSFRLLSDYHDGNFTNSHTRTQTHEHTRAHSHTRTHTHTHTHTHARIRIHTRTLQDCLVLLRFDVSVLCPGTCVAPCCVHLCSWYRSFSLSISLSLSLSSLCVCGVGLGLVCWLDLDVCVCVCVCVPCLSCLDSADSLYIASRLDLDESAPKCRIAFHGRVGRVAFGSVHSARH
jgi:hypothetical protein